MALWWSFGFRWTTLLATAGLSVWVVSGVWVAGGVRTGLGVLLLVATAELAAQLVTGTVPDPVGFVLLGASTLATNALVVWLLSSVAGLLGVDGVLPAVEAVVLISSFAVVVSAAATWLLPRTDPVTASSAAEGEEPRTSAEHGRRGR